MTAPFDPNNLPDPFGDPTKGLQGDPLPDPFTQQTNEPLNSSDQFAQDAFGSAKEDPAGGVINPDLAARWHTRRKGLEEGAEWDLHRHVDLPLPKDRWSRESVAAADMIEQALKNADVSEVHGNGHDQLFVKYKGVYQALNHKFSTEADYNAFLEQLVAEAESVQDWDDLKEDRSGVLQMADGSRLTLVMPPFAKEINFAISKHNLHRVSADFLVQNGTMTQNMLDFLIAATRAKVNIMVVGQMGSGKTSLLSILTEHFDPEERVGIVEQVPEIGVRQKNVVYWTYQPRVAGMTLHDILDVSLYARIDRMIVGEIHDEGLTKMLKVMMKGSNGTMTTYHAGNVEQAVQRMKIDLQLENQNMTSKTALDMIQNSVELVVVLGRMKGVHRCLQISEVDWRSSGSQDKIGLFNLWEYDHASGEHKRASGALDPKGRIREKGAQYGVEFPDLWFQNPEHMRRIIEGK